MVKSEGSQHIYNMLKQTIHTPFGNRIMEELGVIRDLEVDEVKNYILIPNRTKQSDGSEKTTSWEIMELSKKGFKAKQFWDSDKEWLDLSDEDKKSFPNQEINTNKGSEVGR